MADFYKRIDDVFKLDDAMWHFYNSSEFVKAFVNNKGYFIHVNKKFIELTGYSFKELTNKPLFDFIYQEDVDSTLEVYEALEGGQKALKREFINRYICKDNRLLKLRWLKDDMNYNGISLVTAKPLDYDIR